ncbi:hypothetical protein SGFS_036930 [Streptomyces graminofaciens]|uniref:Uncharacterized protein n=1 Tax=Streptomyces graminofaciens TaxID=68212 RepID=A0ABM8HKN8_9ACTN|nr:hypothetical protein SGFS_036930 [Streptomyces graminofaciens]
MKNTPFVSWASREAPSAPGALRTCPQAERDFRKKRGTSFIDRTSSREAMTKAVVSGLAGFGFAQGRVGTVVSPPQLVSGGIYTRQ